MFMTNLAVKNCYARTNGQQILKNS